MSAATRPLSLRKRPDLIVRETWYGSRRYWVVKDPLSLRFYQLRDEEYCILEMLDGKMGIEDIQREFERRYAPRRITASQLQAFLGMLHREGLILADATGQGEELRRRHDRLQLQAFWQRFANPLAIRFRGFDPDRFLQWIYPGVRWLFSTWFFVLVVLLAVSALLLCAVQFDALLSKLPDFHDFFNFRNALWLAAALVVVKILHELGHGLACKHFGGDCHELGFMLLVFTPCLYCNVSDAWLLPSKWRRIAISAAGMYVEIILASVATFLWWFSREGLLNSLCLDVMFVCSVSTILFNGNPLLRYDGYFILADLIESPNLRQQSGAVVRRAAARWFAGMELTPERMLPERGRGLLAVYFAASSVYRWFVIILVLWVLHHALKPYRLQTLVAALAVMVIAGAVAPPLWRIAGFLRNPLRSRQVKWSRLLVRGGLVAGIIAAACLAPLPHRVAVPVIIQAKGAQSVYVSVPGTLTAAVKVGDPVVAEQVLARLTNYEVALEVEKLSGLWKTQQRRLENLIRRQQAGDREADVQLPAAKALLLDLNERLAQRRLDQQRLFLRAPTAGVVLPPPRKPRQAGDALGGWSGTPLEERNRGSYLDRGDLLCKIGDPHRLEAILVIDQADIEFVRVGQRVRIRLSQLPQRFLWGKIREIAEIDLDVVPRELLGEEDLPMRRDEGGVPRPLTASYQARVALDEHDAVLLLSATGKAKIYAPPRPLAQRVYRYLRRTFRFDL